MSAAAARGTKKVYTCHECQPQDVEGRSKFPPVFATEEEFLDHKIAMIKAKRGHLNCHECKTPLRTFQGYIQHMQTVHNKEQDLVCPGCLKKFTRVGGLIGHIEMGRCEGISQRNMDAARVEKASGLRSGLRALDEEHRQNLGHDFRLGPPKINTDYSGHLGIKLSSASKSAGTADDSFVLPNTKGKGPESVGSDGSTSGLKGHQLGLPDDFPSDSTRRYFHGDSKQPDLLTEDNLKVVGPPMDNPWARKPALRSVPCATPTQTASKLGMQPQAPPAVPSAASTSHTAQHKARSLGPIHTQEPSPAVPEPRLTPFDVVKYYDPILRKYTCPHARCGKSMPTPNGLLSHLKSPLHSGEQMLCPGCLRYFPGATALTQHVESQASRCKVRESDQYRTFVDQLTAGLTDVDGRHNDNTVRYIVPETDNAFGKQTGEELRAEVVGNVQKASQTFAQKNLQRKQKPTGW